MRAVYSGLLEHFAIIAVPASLKGYWRHERQHAGLDGMGNESYNDFLKIVNTQPTSSKARKMLSGVMGATNFRPTPGVTKHFNVSSFDKAQAQTRLELAFKSKASTGQSKTVVVPISNFGDGGMSHYRESPGETEV
jgi:hypothetical protein